MLNIFNVLIFLAVSIIMIKRSIWNGNDFISSSIDLNSYLNFEKTFFRFLASLVLLLIMITNVFTLISIYSVILLDLITIFIKEKFINTKSLVFINIFLIIHFLECMISKNEDTTSYREFLMFVKFIISIKITYIYFNEGGYILKGIFDVFEFLFRLIFS